MKIIEPSFEIVYPSLSYESTLEIIEAAARNCYQSEPKGDPEKFIKNIIKKGHLSTIEHVSVSTKIVCDRGVMAELTRHRLTSFSISSTRYCNFSKDKFGNEITVIKPCFWENGSEEYDEWLFAMSSCEMRYMNLLDLGSSPEEARSVLPNSLATTIYMTCNLREFRYIFDLRCSDKAHPQCREVMKIGLKEMHKKYPIFFEDLVKKYLEG